MIKDENKQIGWKTYLKALKLMVKDFLEQTISIMRSLASLLPYPYLIEF